MIVIEQDLDVGVPGEERLLKVLLSDGDADVAHRVGLVEVLRLDLIFDEAACVPSRVGESSERAKEPWADVIPHATTGRGGSELPYLAAELVLVDVEILLRVEDGNFATGPPLPEAST